MDARLRAVCDLMVPEAREFAGLHDYDGQVQDLSPDGVRRGLAALGNGPPLAHPHDEAHLAAFEQLHRVGLGELELHRRNVLPHLANLDLASYDKDYAPATGPDAGSGRRPARLPARSPCRSWPGPGLPGAVARCAGAAPARRGRPGAAARTPPGAPRRVDAPAAGRYRGRPGRGVRRRGRGPAPDRRSRAGRRTPEPRAP